METSAVPDWRLDASGGNEGDAKDVRDCVNAIEAKLIGAVWPSGAQKPEIAILRQIIMVIISLTQFIARMDKKKRKEAQESIKEFLSMDGFVEQLMSEEISWKMIL
jgi:hypothetical protein